MNVLDDTLKHIDTVRISLHRLADELIYRAAHHDESKLQSPEREMYEIWRSKLDSLDIESNEYKFALAEMGEGLKHHYTNNRHHPEHFENGLHGMNLIDIAEMICDWRAASSRNGQSVNMKWASERFGVSESETLYSIIKNTLEILE